MKVLCFIMCFLVLFSFVRVANGTEPLQLRTFVNTLSNFTFDTEALLNAFDNVTAYAETNMPEPFPNIFDGFTNADDIIDIVRGIGRMFSNLGKCIVLLGQWFVYAITVFLLGIILPLWELLLIVFDTMVYIIKTILFFFGFIPSVA